MVHTDAEDNLIILTNMAGRIFSRSFFMLFSIIFKAAAYVLQNVWKVKSMDNNYLKAISVLPLEIYEVLSKIPEDLSFKITAVRIRVDKPVVLEAGASQYFVTRYGQIITINRCDTLSLNRDEVCDCYLSVCEYSIHSYSDDIKKGFITVNGGHRVGICGSAVMKNGEISTVIDITSLSIRIARQIVGIGDSFVQRVFDSGLCSTLIIGEPSSGKTTLLRDVTRILGSGKFTQCKSVSVIDERGEIAGVFSGRILNDLGIKSDVLDGYPKPQGIEIATRTLSPDIIVCDELGCQQEITAITNAVNCGVKFIASCHAKNIDELLNKDTIKKLLKSGVFDKIVVLGSKENPGLIEKVIEVRHLNV